MHARATAEYRAPLTIDVEFDASDLTSNTVQRENRPPATRFDATEFTGHSFATARLTVTAPVGPEAAGHEIRLALVPLQVSGAQRPARPIVYDGATFMPGEPLTVLYQLNTYRITYDVPVLRSRLPEDWEARFGGTLALRDAQVRLTQGTTRRNFANYGPVPLVFGAVHAALGRDWALESDLEAFPAPGGGGLLDTALRLTWRPTSRIAAYAGVRYETGGATDDRFFNFLHTRTAIVGVRAAFLR